MRRVALASAVALIALGLCATTAVATPPTLGAVSASNIQGVSALLIGAVDPEGLSTTYSFEYSLASDLSAATKTPTAQAGSGTDPHPARAAISGLSPDTTYYYRLVATNSSGTATSTLATFITSHGFGFLAGASGFAVAVIADGGAAATVAGSHPYRLGFRIGLNQGGDFEGQPGVPFPDGDLRNLRIDMPPGLLLNPNALFKCTLAQFHTPRSSPFEVSHSGESCPEKTQVGTIEIETSLGGGATRRFGVFNLDPPPGVPAQLGFSPFGLSVVLNIDVHRGEDGSYSLSLDATNFPQSLDVNGLDLALWGTPWAASHNGERGNCLNAAQPAFPWAKCSVGEPLQNVPLAYLTLPGACSGPLSFGASAEAWQQPAEVSAMAVNRDAGGQEAAMDCKALTFGPKPVGQLTDSKASSPSGYNFTLTNDQAGLTDTSLRAPPPARKAVVRLPSGVTLNPSVGAGLGVCTPDRYAAESATSLQGAGCPNASKIGDFSVRSSLFDDLFEGAIYLAAPDNPATATPGVENPFDTLAAVYLVARLPERGTLIKVAGKIVPDPATGTLTATFDGLPQLPYSELDLTFRTGQRAVLITPPSCGAATTTIEMTSWASSLSPVHTTTDSQIKTGIGGGPCPSGTPPFTPGVVAGGVNSNVNSYTPYFVHLTRQDTEQEITSYSLVLPKGITAKLAGIPFCPDAAIEAARAKRGSAEEASPSCPAASQVGRTLTGYGVGSALTYTGGRIYLAGPYHGQPLSVVTINPATVGPFDLGTVVIRSAFAVDPLTARLRIDSKASDPIPHILGGVPLHLRDVRIYMDRPQFTHNPSSCEASQLISALGGSGVAFDTAADDTTASVSKHFQLLNCRTLGFQPRLGVRLRGATRRGGYPRLRATFAARGPRDTNLKEIAVTIPHQEFLAQNHIKGICTRAQFANQNCPANSIYGSAVAYTPLFDKPLRGDVYLRSSAGRRLPDLVADLYSGAIRIILEGKIGPGKKGGIRALFSDLPDEPLDRFVMTLAGGKRGLLVNSADICAVPPVSSVKALGQNNLGAVFTTTLRGQCGKKQHPQSRRKRGRQ